MHHLIDLLVKNYNYNNYDEIMRIKYELYLNQVTNSKKN